MGIPPILPRPSSCKPMWAMDYPPIISPSSPPQKFLSDFVRQLNHVLRKQFLRDYIFPCHVLQCQENAHIHMHAHAFIQNKTTDKNKYLTCRHTTQLQFARTGKHIDIYVDTYVHTSKYTVRYTTIHYLTSHKSTRNYI